MAFRGKLALITGAASGIGRGAALRLAESGAIVAALDRDEEGLRQTASGRSNIHCFAVDVANPHAIDATVHEIEERFGPIDRLLHAAAIMPTDPIALQPRDTIHRILEINIGGTVNVANAVLPRMLERGCGDFVVLGSMSGWIPAPHLGAYCASKAAVNTFCEVLQHENRHSGLRFACVCPPKVDTPMLEQATSHPKWLERESAISVDCVIDALERGLERGRFWIFPGRKTRLAWWVRRFAPGLPWRHFHRIEGI